MLFIIVIVLTALLNWSCMSVNYVTRLILIELSIYNCFCHKHQNRNSIINTASEFVSITCAPFISGNFFIRVKTNQRTCLEVTESSV